MEGLPWPTSKQNKICIKKGARWTSRFLCPIYGRKDESSIHCSTTNDVWGEDISPLKKWPTIVTSVWDMWQRVICRLCYVKIELVAFILRTSWIGINTFIFENKFDSPKSIIQTTRRSSKEYKYANEPHHIS